MKIIKCPACKQYVHFDCAPGIIKCWSCGAISDFSRIASAPEKALTAMDRALGSLPFPDMSSPAFLKAGKAGVLLALPVAITMLLICNSFNISVVHDLSDSFHSISIQTAHFINCMSFN